MVEITQDELGSLLVRQPSGILKRLLARHCLRAFKYIGELIEPNDEIALTRTVALSSARIAMSLSVACALGKTPVGSSARLMVSERPARTAGALAKLGVGYSAFSSMLIAFEIAHDPGILENSGALFLSDVRSTDSALLNALASDLFSAEEGVPEQAYAGNLKRIAAQELMLPSLWPISGGSDDVAAFYASKVFESVGPSWQFWERWHRALVLGKPLDWELLEEIDRGLTDNDWIAGERHIATRIREIEEQYLIDQAPLAETVVFDTQSGRFYAQPIEKQSIPATNALLERILGALDMASGSNVLRIDTPIAEYLHRTCTDLRDDPQQLELNLTDAAGILRHQVEVTGELPDDSYCQNLRSAVEDTVRFIRLKHPEVAKTREDLAELNLATIRDEDVETLQAAQPVLEALSQGQMQADFARDIPEIINSSRGPVPNTAPPLPGVVRTVNRAGKIAQMLVEYRAWCQTEDANTASTTAAIAGAIYSVIQFGLKIFGVL